MSTTIKLKVDGITDEMEVTNMAFSYSSFANVSNPTKKIDFTAIAISDFTFMIMEPTKDTITALLKWITTHEIKENAKFDIRKQGESESPRSIALKKVCLTAYSENFGSDGSSFSLSVVGQIVNVDDVEVDMTEER
jgi:hypothetical protein